MRQEIMPIINFITKEFPELSCHTSLEGEIRWDRRNHPLAIFVTGEQLSLYLGERATSPPYTNHSTRVLRYSLRKPLPYGDIEKAILDYWLNKP